MNWNRLQRPMLLVPRVSRQRWALMAVGVLAASAASMFTALAAGHQVGVVLALILGFAVASVLLPDSHATTATETIVVLQWWAMTDRNTSAWSILVALSLFVFHAAVALMALTPITATIARSIVLRWARRSALIVVATLAMWSLVLLLNERRATGSAALTAIGLVTLTGLILVTRAHSAPTADHGDERELP